MRSSRRDFQLFIGQYRIILSADTASEVRQMAASAGGPGTAAGRAEVGLCPRRGPPPISSAPHTPPPPRRCREGGMFPRVIPPIILFRLFQLADQLVGTGCREA